MIPDYFTQIYVNIHIVNNAYDEDIKENVCKCMKFSILKQLYVKNGIS